MVPNKTCRVAAEKRVRVGGRSNMRRHQFTSFLVFLASASLFAAVGCGSPRHLNRDDAGDAGGDTNTASDSGNSDARSDSAPDGLGTGGIIVPGSGGAGGQPGSGGHGGSGTGGTGTGGGGSGTGGGGASGGSGAGGMGTGGSGPGGNGAGGSGAGGNAAGGNSGTGGSSAAVLPPRLIAPLSTATVTSRRPVLHWSLASNTDGAHVQICRDRACLNQVTSFDASGSSGAPSADLPVGVLFWRAAGRSGGVTGTQWTFTWQFTTGARSAAVSSSWGTTLDVNGDGYADVIIGADSVMTSAGRAYLFPGGASGISATQQPIVFSGSDGASARFGVSVASAADINGDGYGDLIVGGSGAVSSTGKVYVYLGSASGAQASTPILGPDGTFGYFGGAVASAGDVNGDGYGDIVVGAGNGRAHVFLGSGTGLSATPITLLAPDPNTSFGVSVAGVGDVNGDGFADFMVGADGLMASPGVAYLYLGNGSIQSTSPTRMTFTDPTGADSYFGHSLACAGDVNSDGYPDIAIGSFGATGTGRVYLYHGGASGVSAVATSVLAAPDGASSNFGASVASAGDINNDGYGDIIVGAYGVANRTGKAYLYIGGSSGVVASQQPIAFSGPDGMLGNFGASVASAGDINGDGYVDSLVGANTVASGTGRAYIYVGSMAGFMSSQQPIPLSAPDGAGSDFGLSIASAIEPASEKVCIWDHS